MAGMVVEEEMAFRPSDDDKDQIRIQRGMKPEKDAAVGMALAITATAAVELTNLFFLHDDIERRRQRRRQCCREIGPVPALEAVIALSAFVALVCASSGALVLLLCTTGHRRSCGGVLVAASAAALLAASVGTVFYLLHVQGLLQYGAFSARATVRGKNV